MHEIFIIKIVILKKTRNQNSKLIENIIQLTVKKSVFPKVI